jgi:hypothetical protein
MTQEKDKNERSGVIGRAVRLAINENFVPFVVKE